MTTNEAEDSEAREGTDEDGGESTALERAVENAREAKALAIAIAEAAIDRKANRVEIIEVVGKVDYCDYVVVLSARSDRQVASLAKNIEGEVKTKLGARCLSVEGLPQARWVLMDFGDVIAHIFHEETRGYYDLESLWMDAPRVPVPGASVPGAPASRKP